jgi:hypothetical protein
MVTECWYFFPAVVNIGLMVFKTYLSRCASYLPRWVPSWPLCLLRYTSRCQPIHLSVGTPLVIKVVAIEAARHIGLQAFLLECFMLVYVGVLYKLPNTYLDSSSPTCQDVRLKRSFLIDVSLSCQFHAC